MVRNIENLIMIQELLLENAEIMAVVLGVLAIDYITLKSKNKQQYKKLKNIYKKVTNMVYKTGFVTFYYGYVTTNS